MQSTSIELIKQDMIDKVISKMSKFNFSTELEKQTYINSIKSSINNKQILTKVREQSGITNADDYNKTAFEIYLDLLTVFEYLDNLSSIIDNHQKLNESIINSLYSSIGNLEDKLEECNSIISITGMPYCKYESFRTQNNQEWDRKYYTERYGERFPLETFVKFNQNQENISLNYTRQQNTLMYKSGVQLGEISITKQYGASFITARNSETKLENCIDTSNTSYWAETILADSEIKIKGIGYESATDLGKYNRSFYDLPRGALCEICITFEALSKINEIILKPFGTFPIDIIAIRYTLSDIEDDDCYDIVYPDNDKEWLSTTTINKEHAFHFHEITCKKLYILINQLHFIKDTYLIDSNKMFKNELWFNSTYNETDDIYMENTSVFQPCYIDKGIEEPIWRYVNNKLISNKKIDINDLLINNKHIKIPKTKYQYTYGLYNLIPNYVEFQRAGVWVSKDIEVNGPIDTISLTSDETHFRTSNNYIASDIEFYITTKSNPTYQDWKPICPKNKNYVNKELLQLDYEYCFLRHEAICGNMVTIDKDGNQITNMERPIVYYNDIILTEDADYILRYNDSGNVYAIDISNIDRFGMYTISYTPVDSSKEISLIDDTSNPVPNNTFEEIMGTGASFYKLNGFPYYDRQNPENTMSYVKIVDTDTNKIMYQTNSSDSNIVCVTNKDNPSDSYKNLVANTGKIQYYTNGRYVYFSRPITKTEKIEINYPSLDSKVRVKVILRRNTKRDTWLTPILNSYKIEMTTL